MSENSRQIELIIWGRDPGSSVDEDLGFSIVKSAENKYQIYSMNDLNNDQELFATRFGNEEFESYSAAYNRLQEVVERDLYTNYTFGTIFVRAEEPPVYETVIRAKRSTPEKRAEKEKPQVEKPEEKLKELPEEKPIHKKAKQIKPRQEKSQKVTIDPNEPEPYTGGTLVEDIEHWIPTLFKPAKEGVKQLKSELEEDVNESNWVAKAAAASFLDVLDTAMSFTEGIPLGILDTRNIGQGAAKGTVEGVMEDVSRALNVLPQGKVLKLVDRAITTHQVVKAVQEGDMKTAALTAGLSVTNASGSKAFARAGSKMVTQPAAKVVGKAVRPLKGKSKTKSKTTAEKPKRYKAEKSKAYKELERSGIIKDIPLKGNPKSPWHKFQKEALGDREYRIQLKDGNIFEADGLKVNPKNGKLILQEAKLALSKDIAKSGHLMAPDKKVIQLKKYVQALKDYPDHFSHIELHYNARNAGEIFKNIVEQKLTVRELARIKFVHSPWGHQ